MPQANPGAVGDPDDDDGEGPHDELRRAAASDLPRGAGRGRQYVTSER